MKNIDKYLFQALDNYPYSLEETIESLDYALSYDSKNTTALCLYGRIQTEQLQNYEEVDSNHTQYFPNVQFQKFQFLILPNSTLPWKLIVQVEGDNPETPMYPGQKYY